MGDSGAEDTSDSLTESDLDQIARDAEAIQGGRTETQGTVFGVNGVSATGSTERDREIGYSDGRGNPGPNFEAFGGVRNESGEPIGKVAQTPSQFAAALEATQGGDTGTTVGSIGIPTIEAASSTLAPGAFQDQRTIDMLADTTGAKVPISNVLTETVVDRNPTIVDQLKNLATNFGELREFYNNPIFQAAVEKADREQAEKSDLQKIQEALDAGTEAENLDRPIGSTVGDDFGPALDIVDARTTATGTNLPEDFEENVGRAFSPERMADIERLYNLPVGQTKTGKGTDPAFFEGLGIPGLFTSIADKAEMLTREQMANDIALGRPRSAFEMFKGFTATPAESIEEFNKRMDTIPENQLVRNNSGRVIGIKDADGRLVTGTDPDKIEDSGDGGEQVRRAPPKAPTDPCPDGYQLIDGKCTPVATDDKGTGFIMFPPDRTPPFQTGPFEPKTQATDPSSITPLNPLTFGISNIFRR